MTSAHEIRRSTRVRELSRMRIGELKAVESKRLTEKGMHRVYGGPHNKDEFITSILELEGLNEAVLS